MTPPQDVAAGRVLNWDGLRGELAADPDFGPVGIRQIHIGAGTLHRLADTVADLRAGREGAAVLLRDDVLKLGESGDLHDEVAAAVGRSGPVRSLTAPSRHGLVHADEATVEAVLAGTSEAAALVTVGSGTLTDLGKLAAASHDLPHVVVQTAASVNGFADDQSVLLRSGVKRTVPTRWPDALIVDTGVLARAPAALNRAGFGDLLSMFTALPDWLLGDRAGFPVRYSQEVVNLVRPHGERLLELAPKLASVDHNALAVLAELLTLSGLSMGVAQCTNPSSGMEHLVSHMLDMYSSATGRPTASHGSQVGVGALVASATWVRVRRALADGGSGTVSLPDTDEARARVEAAFLPLDPTGAAAAECWNAYQRKLTRTAALMPALQELVDDWAPFDTRAQLLLADPDRLVAAQKAIGAPTRFRDLDPAFDAATARWAITNAHLMRDRFTIADLADLLGLGGADGTEAVLGGLESRGAGL